MKQFNGFPAKMKFTPVPNIFFSNLLPQIDNYTELITTLFIFMVLYGKRGYPRFVTYRELCGDKSLINSLAREGKSPDKLLRDALEMAVERGTVLHLVLDRDSTSEDVYFLNTEADRQMVTRIRDGDFVLAGLKASHQAYPDVKTEKPPDIFTLYEENIGMLTPLIAEWLKEAEKLYPEAWIRDAVKEAVSLNKRSWRYIDRILERWSAEGRSDGTHQRGVKKTDPDKYIKGKYGHIVQR